MTSKNDYIHPEDVREALLRSIAQLDGKLSALIELQSAILAFLTKDDATKVAARYKKKATEAGHKRMNDIRRELANENLQRLKEAQREDNF